MNSTQTTGQDTADTPTAAEAGSASSEGTRKVTRGEAMRILNQNAHLWCQVLDQTDFWVPRGAWDRFEAVSTHEYRPVKADFDVDGVVAVADMDWSWRTSVRNFLARKTLRIAHGRTYDLWLSAGGPYDRPDLGVEEHKTWQDLLRDEAARMRWLDAQPLAVELAATIAADRDSRLSRPVVLEPVPAVEHPMGLILSR